MFSARIIAAHWHIIFCWVSSSTWIFPAVEGHFTCVRFHVKQLYQVSIEHEQTNGDKKACTHHIYLQGLRVWPASLRQLCHPGVALGGAAADGALQVLRCSRPPRHAPLAFPFLLRRHLSRQPPEARIFAVRIYRAPLPGVLWAGQKHIRHAPPARHTGMVTFAELMTIPDCHKDGP